LVEKGQFDRLIEHDATDEDSMIKDELVFLSYAPVLNSLKRVDKYQLKDTLYYLIDNVSNNGNTKLFIALPKFVNNFCKKS
jgi:hypothetical protein